MDDKDTLHRRARLRELIAHCFNGKDADLLDYIQQRTGKRPNQGEMSSLQKDHHGSRSFGAKKASTLEAQIGLPKLWFSMPLGWALNMPHWDNYGPAEPDGAQLEEATAMYLTDALSAGPKIHGKLPLISWVRAGELCEAPDNFQPGDAEEWLDCPVKHGPNAYCLRVKGDSMDDGTAGGYRDGEIIFVDPAIGAVAGHDVVVRTPDGKTTFKRLKRDQEGLYLLGLNGKKIIRVPEGTVFCGVVIFSGVKR